MLASPHLHQIFSEDQKVREINGFSPNMSLTRTKVAGYLILINFLPDYGLDVFTQHREKTEFPWIISNVIDSESGQPLGGGKVHHTIEWEGRKLGKKN